MLAEPILGGPGIALNFQPARLLVCPVLPMSTLCLSLVRFLSTCPGAALRSRRLAESVVSRSMVWKASRPSHLNFYNFSKPKQTLGASLSYTEATARHFQLLRLLQSHATPTSTSKLCAARAPNSRAKASPFMAMLTAPCPSLVCAPCA